ncbi:SDR family NAD(P)-dependent oxidoreductase [Microbulbifer sp. SH-1]|uniref:type I polyketide synthase n=1 Tax=Microbulbifer sp. SH-1 TaxID=2681547 RepID=UPI00140CD3CC|nr:type I polyketide synthase [Microbulbifer sp. SH-1]QIL90220.1 SDR family NAD(P)-dependent oxidoreductase [Microbulbifer sp. SH-1]
MSDSYTQLEPHGNDHNIMENDIAIVGMSCRLPGNVNNPESFFAFLLDGGDGIVEVPGDRWENSAYYDQDKDKPNKMYVNQGGFIKNIDLFDPQFFGISPKEAPHLDPQHRWLLELAYEVFENAGMKASELKGSNTAVYIGQFMHDYEQVQLSSSAHKLMTSHSATGPSMTLTANRISYTFDFTGPSVSLDTACSSSLVALDLACKAILTGDSDMAIAGGVNILLRPELTMSICKASMLSPDCRCKSFDAAANGYVRSEGAGLVLLKKREAAERDGDNILAVIKATGVNQDGQTIGITVPNGESQKALLKKSLQRAGLSPSTIQYAEAHGTGTAVGDPIEVNALGEVLGDRSIDTPSCVVGSVKSNIGHSEATAGVAGLMKTVMAMRAGRIPQNIHYHTPNPAIDLEKLNVRIADKQIDWPDTDGQPRRAMVNSFGFGGTNANVILQQAPAIKRAPATQAPVVNGEIKLLLISHKTESGLKQQAQKMAGYLQQDLLDRDDADALLHHVCYTSAIKREHFKHRLVVSGDSVSAMIAGLEDFVEGRASGSYIQSSAEESPAKKPCFVFSGMGPQWSGMGRRLYQSEPVYRAALDRCSEALSHYTGWSLVDAIFNSQDQEEIHQTCIAQPAIFATQVALSELLASWGIEAGCIVGHSAGEVGAAYIAGALSFDDAIKVIYHRSQLQHTTEGMGKMLAVGLSEANLVPYLAGLDEKVSIAAVNSEEAITLAGDAEALARIAEQLDEQGIFARFLSVGVPYHSPVMDQLKAPLQEALTGIVVHTPTTPLYSSVSAKPTCEGDWGAAYWPENVRAPVRFKDAIENIFNDGYTTFIEISPHPTLISSITSSLKQCRVVSTLNRKHADDVILQHTLAAMHAKGILVNWSALYPNAGCLMPLPNYVWQHASYWSEADDVKQARLKNIQLGAGYAEPVHPLLGSPLKTSAPAWQKTVDLHEIPFLDGHKVAEDVVYPGAAYIESALAMARLRHGRNDITLENLEFIRACFIDKDNPAQFESRLLEGEYEFEINALDTSSNWITYCRGGISALTKQAPRGQVSLEEITQRLSRHMDKSAFYAHCHALGLCYEDAFQLVEQAWYVDDECVVEVRPQSAIIDTGADYLLHPVLLDGAFQGLFPTVQKGYLPVKIGALHFHRAPGAHFYCHLVTDYKDEHRIVGHLTLFDKDGNILVEVDSIELRAHQPVESGDADKAIEYDYFWERMPLNTDHAASNNGVWVVFADNQGIADKLVSTLAAKDVAVHVVPATTEINGPDDFLPALRAVNNHCAGILYMWGIDNPNCEEQSSEEVLASCRVTSVIPMYLVQAMNKLDWPNALKLFFVTQGVHRLGGDTHLPQPSQGALWGFARVLASEHAEYSVSLLDLADTVDDSLIHTLADHLQSDQYEQETALRAGERYVGRLRKVNAAILDEYADGETVIDASDGYQVTGYSDQGIASVRLHALRMPPLDDNQVRVRVRAAGPDQGSILAGVVEAVGSSVKAWSRGENVIVLGEQTRASHVHVTTDSLIPLPVGLSYIQAVAVGEHFSVAYYALNELAILRAGEKVLIYGGDSAAAHAAAQLARAKNAKVYAAADTEEKRQRLSATGVLRVLDSSTYECSSQLMEALHSDEGDTNFDVVLNFEEGIGYERIASLIDDFGRFVDLRKTATGCGRSFIENLTKKNASYHRANTHDLARKHPERYRCLIQEAVDAFAKISNQFSQNLIDVHVVGMDGNTELPKSEPIPTVLDFNAAKVTAARGINPDLIKADKTYLVTGGLGGLGLVMLDWLVSSGATSVALTGRSTPNENAQQKIAEAQSRGVDVHIVRADVSDARAMGDALSALKTSDKPLAGIVHSAGVLSDGVIAQQTEEQFQRVLAPKVSGTWNLHTLTKDIDLDFFVCFSSIASLVGWSGQSNYAAANAFMDTLAFHRRALGQPALSVNWGPWAEAGMAASLDERDIRRMKDAGMTPLSPESGVRSMTRLLAHHVPQAGVFELDWSKILKQYADPRKKTLFSNFIDTDVLKNEADFLDLLNSASQLEKESLLSGRVTTLLADVLGIENAESLDPNCNIYEYGLNSLMALEFSNRLQGVLKAKISSTLVMKYPTINGLVDYVVSHVVTAPGAVASADTSTEQETKTVIAGNALLNVDDENNVEVEW